MAEWDVVAIDGCRPIRVRRYSNEELAERARRRREEQVRAKERNAWWAAAPDHCKDMIFGSFLVTAILSALFGIFIGAWLLR